jgi:hypothetical protein
LKCLSGLKIEDTVGASPHAPGIFDARRNEVWREDWMRRPETRERHEKGLICSTPS